MHILKPLLRQLIVTPERLGRAGAPMFSVVVFSDRCTFKSVSVSSPDVVVCQQKQLPRIVRSIWRSAPDALSQSALDTLYIRLLPLTSPSAAVQQHIHDVAERQQAAVGGLVCPLCGGTLVLRTAKRGPGAGHSFYGCANFPNCRYTKNIS